MKVEELVAELMKYPLDTEVYVMFQNSCDSVDMTAAFDVDYLCEPGDDYNHPNNTYYIELT